MLEAQEDCSVKSGGQGRPARESDIGRFEGSERGGHVHVWGKRISGRGTASAKAVRWEEQDQGSV